MNSFKKSHDTILAHVENSQIYEPHKPLLPVQPLLKSVQLI